MNDEEEASSYNPEATHKASNQKFLKCHMKKLQKKEKDGKSNRKDEKLLKILINAYASYEGKWDEKKFRCLVAQTGLNKSQLNKWFWDRRKRDKDSIKARRCSYPGLLFEITDTKTGKDLTPMFRRLFTKNSETLFKVEKQAKSA